MKKGIGFIGIISALSIFLANLIYKKNKKR